jgi:hypothetical protein
MRVAKVDIDTGVDADAGMCRHFHASTVLDVGGGEDYRDEYSGAVEQHVAFDAIDFLCAVEPARPGDR